MWAWTCSEHKARGVHHYNRFTDRIKRKTQPPWERCRDGAMLHWHRFHSEYHQES